MPLSCFANAMDATPFPIPTSNIVSPCLALTAEASNIVSEPDLPPSVNCSIEIDPPKNLFIEVFFSFFIIFLFLNYQFKTCLFISKNNL